MFVLLSNIKIDIYLFCVICIFQRCVYVLYATI